MVFNLKFILFITMSDFPWLTIIVLLPISTGFLIPLLPYRGNNIIRWYSLGVCLLEFLLITYVFCYHFASDNEFMQLKEDYNWINFLIFIGD